MLDAKECATEFWSATADDITMRETTKDLYSCTAHEKSRLWALQGIQRNSVGKCHFHIEDFKAQQHLKSLIQKLINGFTNC